MEYDSKTKQLSKIAVVAQSITSDGDTAGIIIDTKDFESITFSMMVHSIGGQGITLLRWRMGMILVYQMPPMFLLRMILKLWSELLKLWTLLWI